MNWTTEQILGLAPDQFTLRAARSTAEPERWNALHHDGRLLWAIFPNGSTKTAETAVHLTSHTHTCTCNSRKTPCRHTVALLLLWQENRPAFTAQPAPHTLAARARRHAMASQRPFRSGYSLETQLANLQTGLNELSLWLTDLVRHGLARLPDRPKSYWQTMANRLVDAQAPILAEEVRRLATVPTAQSNWPEEYLQRLGRLHLIVQGFRHFDQLPSATQADLQTAVGWLPHSHNNNTTVTDHWLVLGRQQEVLGSQMRHFTWLWGQDSQQPAQLIELAAVARPEGRCLPTGTVWHGTLQFLPGSWPLLATRQGDWLEQGTAVYPHGFPTIHDATQAHSHALAHNPWLPAFPMLLHNVLSHHSDDTWQLLDRRGTSLPLPDKFAHGWHLAAMAGGASSLTLFGVWQNRILHPLSVNHTGVWHDVHTWRGIR